MFNFRKIAQFSRKWAYVFEIEKESGRMVKENVFPNFKE